MTSLGYIELGVIVVHEQKYLGHFVFEDDIAFEKENNFLVQILMKFVVKGPVNNKSSLV